ncbi:aspartyl protease BAR1 KNAG_0H02760 [Huiozyma naganishii CBS 8797]|uniref:Peptidase A1 domain-containing protein n=1 Tax=Huiozyma naganishii (strain ATCC MYA-139 / BCRC 22969 / CBS 8797 / KCTC 17520 / NBRC 10181 / NCYC 3082 / Yp74L-3) TaxID=1071383 RepID=J7S9T1_HUIN7|nr:hypothetical protein KNAG_0H02760 [Kazachstania naganishii CBS 8797]CCK71691.1 hypothetical protein KNAG_0H02760 [Kazachstania naganishii CBS 8797]
MLLLYVQVLLAAISPFLSILVECSPLALPSTHQKFSTQLAKRNHLKFDLQFEDESFYATTLKIGDPPQEITVIFDSGSADTWVMSRYNPFCLSSSNITANGLKTLYDGKAIIPKVDCSQIKTYNANRSTSFQELNNGRFYIIYGDKTFADGIWGTETFEFGGVKIPNVQFGLADYATTPIGGVLGIGFQRRESVKGYTNAPEVFYPNFPQVLKNEGIIDTVAYSLSLGQSSHIMFGAIDRNSYIGDMVTFPMINMFPNAVSKPATLSITIQGLGAQNKQECKFQTFSTTKYPALLDSGSTLISAPVEIADKMAAFIGAQWSESDGIYTLECPNDTTNIDYIFDFGDMKFTLPLSNLILPSQGGSNVCGFGLQRSDNEIVLGDVFLCSTLVVFDLDHYQISLAKSNQKSSAEDIVNIPSDGKIPGAIIAKAEAWTTYEPITATTDMFETERSHCGIRSATSSVVNSAKSSFTNVKSATWEVASNTTIKSSVESSSKLFLSKGFSSMSNSKKTGISTHPQHVKSLRASSSIISTNTSPVEMSKITITTTIRETSVITRTVCGTQP